MCIAVDGESASASAAQHYLQGGSIGIDEGRSRSSSLSLIEFSYRKRLWTLEPFLGPAPKWGLELALKKCARFPLNPPHSTFQAENQIQLQPPSPSPRSPLKHNGSSAADMTDLTGESSECSTAPDPARASDTSFQFLSATSVGLVSMTSRPVTSCYFHFLSL